MPRWYRRETADYSHLVGRSLAVILDRAIENRAYGQDKPRFPAEVNETLLGWFAGRDLLTASEAFDIGAPARTARGWSAEFTVDWVGTRIGWGLHLGLLAEAPAPDGERAWGMPDREIQYDVHRGRARRIRGLPPNEQFLMDRRRAREARLRATLDAKHARKITPHIEKALADMTASEPDIAMPANWSDFIGRDVMERWPTVAEARGLLVDLHLAWPRERQKEWLIHVTSEANAVFMRAFCREGERQAAADALLAEDADAFAGL